MTSTRAGWRRRPSESSAPADPPRLQLDLTEPEPIPEEGITRALELMRDGRLFRYGESAGGGKVDDVALFESEFAQLIGRRYAVGVNSCGSALFLALRAGGIGPGDHVLVNSFTLAPVPGAIAHCGAKPVLVEVTDGCTIDLDDLRAKAVAGAKALLISHMRGHVSDMDAVTSICDRYGLLLVEDCAHALGARWNNRLAGAFGHAACFSTQTFKHLNSGEGGVIVTDDDVLAAKAILHAGSYMLYEQHLARPPMQTFLALRDVVPNFSLRMTAIAAAVLRPQLALLPARIDRWNSLYAELAAQLERIPEITLVPRAPLEQFVGSSLQFYLATLPPDRIERAVAICAGLGLHVKWFGRAEALGFTSRPDHWAYLQEEQVVPRTNALLATLCDIRIPVAMSAADCRVVAEILGHALRATAPEA